MCLTWWQRCSTQQTNLITSFLSSQSSENAVGKSIKRNNHSRQLNAREATATADEFSSLSDKRRNLPPNKQPRHQVKQIGEVFRTNQFSINFTSFSQARFAAFEPLEYPRLPCENYFSSKITYRDERELGRITGSPKLNNTDFLIIFQSFVIACRITCLILRSGKRFCILLVYYGYLSNPCPITYVCQRRCCGKLDGL